MHIDDLYADILDEDPFEDNDNSKDDDYQWLFPIKGYESSKNIFFDNGTGFFVNNTGYFVTAGHVLKNTELTYKAIINNLELDFDVIFREYVSVKCQDSQSCNDLAICKINIQKHVDHYFDTNYPINKMVHFSGYSRGIINGIQINPIKIGDLYQQHCQGVDEKSIKPRIEDNRPICNNTRSLKLTEGLRYGGLSGGPVYDGKSVYGMLIGSEYILSEYIIEKLHPLNIPFNTY